MHDCQKFREDWIAGSAEDFGDCVECRSFCEEAQAILQATDGAAQPIPELNEEYWNGFENRLHESLIRENASRSSHLYWKWGALAAAAAIAFVVTWGVVRARQPIANETAGTLQIEYVDDHIAGLDPMVVAFLGQSELFLRGFTKIQPSYTEDIDDARARAKKGLMEIEEQKALAGRFAPVRIALDEYESVLREIKNLGAGEDLTDLQGRIRRNGLIANLKAYQPHVVLVSQR